MRKIAIKYGLWMLAGFIAFFLLMHLIGRSENTWLRVFNGAIHLGLIYMAIRDYRLEYPESVNNYVSGVATGMYTSVFGVIGFVVFMLLFFIFNPTFLDSVQDNIPISRYVTPITATLFILVEGIAISLIGAYIITRIVDMQMAKSR